MAPTTFPKGSVVITGASGQDGLLATELLLRRGYSVFAIIKDSANLNFFQELIPNAFWMPFSGLDRFSEFTQGGEGLNAIIHLASNSSVPQSWLDPVNTLSASIQTLRPILAIAERFDAPLILAGSSQIFAPSDDPISGEVAPMPQSPYGVGKLAAQNLLRVLRAEGRVRGSNATLFNHDSPLRAPYALMSRLSSDFLGHIQGRESRIVVPNPHVGRDFSWAPDFVKVLCNPEFWESGEDIALGSGVATTIHSLVQTAAETLDIGEENFDYVTTEVEDRPTISGGREATLAFGFEQTIESKFVLSKIIELLLRESNVARGLGDTKRAILLRLVDEM